MRPAKIEANTVIDLVTAPRAEVAARMGGRG
jgi:hypothetical protein